MKVSRTRDVKQGTGPRPAGRSSPVGEFASHLRESGETPPSSGTEASGPGTVDGILAVQEAQGAGGERLRKRTGDYGEDLLDKLEEIRRALLSGVLSKDRLVALAQAVRARRQQSDDPRLNKIIEEIELRAEVEIAKLTRTS